MAGNSRNSRLSHPYSIKLVREYQSFVHGFCASTTYLKVYVNTSVLFINNHTKTSKCVAAAV